MMSYHLSPASWMFYGIAIVDWEGLSYYNHYPNLLVYFIV